jgi:hypothetical protein
VGNVNVLPQILARFGLSYGVASIEDARNLAVKIGLDAEYSLVQSPFP